MVTVGPYWAAIEHKLQKSKFLVKGLTPAQRDTKMSRLLEHNCFLEIDYSRFDRSISYEILQAIEVQIAELFFPRKEYPTFHAALQSELNTSGITRDGYMYKTHGGRCSGDAQTSIGNGLTNRFNTWYIIHPADPNFDSINEGDDGVAAFDRRHEFNVLDNLQYLPLLGFEIKAKFSHNIDGVVFCGRILYDAGHKLGSFSDVPRQLSKFHVNTSSLSDKQYLVAKALSLLVDNPNTPVLTALCCAYLRCLSDVTLSAKQISRSRFDEFTKRKIFPERNYNDFPPSPNARAALAIHSIPVNKQITLEQHYRSWSFIPSNPVQLIVDPNEIPDNVQIVEFP